MRGVDLQSLIQSVGEDDLKKAAAKAEANRKAMQELRAQQGGMNVSELMLALSQEDGEEGHQQSVPQLHEKENTNVERSKPSSGFFPTPPGK